MYTTLITCLSPFTFHFLLFTFHLLSFELNSCYNLTQVKLVVCIVHNRDKSRITDEMVKAGYKFTIIGSTGGFLREGNTTFLIGVEDEDLPNVQHIVAENCSAREQLVNITPFEAAPPGAFIPSPVKVPVGGAILFVLNVDQYHRY
jgi:uncharacterized protein YaaQ